MNYWFSILPLERPLPPKGQIFDAVIEKYYFIVLSREAMPLIMSFFHCKLCGLIRGGLLYSIMGGGGNYPNIC